MDGPKTQDFALQTTPSTQLSLPNHDGRGVQIQGLAPARPALLCKSLSAFLRVGIQHIGGHGLTRQLIG